MNSTNLNDKLIYTVEGCDSDGKAFIAAVQKSRFVFYREIGMLVPMHHFFLIVDTGLINSKTRFKGLKRPLWHEDQPDADCDKEVHCWNSRCDFDWADYDRFSTKEHPGIIETSKPEGCIYFAILSPNKCLEKYPGIDYWIDHWGWVEESNTLECAPVDWENRYSQKI